MPKCNNCDGKVLRTDAFCGACGEPVPGGKPVVRISRELSVADLTRASEPVSGTFPPPATASGSASTSAPASATARAMAVVAISEPPIAESPDTGLSRTTIREREQKSEPAPVLPLRRKKAGSDSQEQSAASVESAREEPVEATMPERETGASIPNMPIPVRPPILASDLLREQMRPSSPGAKALRRATVSLCAIGAVAVLVTGGVHPLTFVSLALLITAATLALTPMRYEGRAAALFLTGAVATGIALWQQTLQGIAPEGIILAGATILLSGSLLFRAYYRGARLARIAVTFGVLALGAWFVISRGHESLVMLDGDWRSWAPASTHMSFGLLALLSLMAFMDSSTRGGSHVWAVSLLVLYAVHIGLIVASEVWPVYPAARTIEGPTIAAILAGMIGTIVAGLALAQVLVAAYKAISSRRTQQR